MTTAGTMSAPTTLPVLAGEDVHVWFIDLEEAQRNAAALMAPLSPGERARGDRFHFPRDRFQFCATRGILRHLAGAYLGSAPSRLEFEAGACGKLRLAGSSSDRFAFNVSHSAGFALIAASPRGELGVDIEAARPIADRDALAGQFFSAAEIAGLQSLEPGSRDEAFFTCWSRKEAYVKAVGDGLSYPLEAFDVTFVPGDVVRLTVPSDSQESSRWALEALPAPPGYAAALVTEGRRSVSCWTWNPSVIEEAL
jgi:4'-phosphopantetheinyl transferase